jgi:hypothetical protein
MSSHLNDNELAEVLAGNTSQTVMAHLGVCPECSFEARQLSDAITSFREGLSSVAVQPRRRHVRHRLLAGGPVLRFAGAFALLLMLAGGIALDNRSPRMQSAAPAPQVSDAELLNEVQSELTADSPAALQPAAYLADQRQELLQSSSQAQPNRERRQ